MNGLNPAILATLTAIQLQRLGEAKQRFDTEVNAILGNSAPAPASAGSSAAGAPPATASTAPAAPAPTGKRVMSEATKRAIALKQKANWAKRNRLAKSGKGGTKVKATGGGMSPAVKRKIAAAQRARWAERKGQAAQPAAATVPAAPAAAPQQAAA